MFSLGKDPKTCSPVEPPSASAGCLEVGVLVSTCSFPAGAVWLSE